MPYLSSRRTSREEEDGRLADPRYGLRWPVPGSYSRNVPRGSYSTTTAVPAKDRGDRTVYHARGAGTAMGRERKKPAEAGLGPTCFRTPPELVSSRRRLGVVFRYPQWTSRRIIRNLRGQASERRQFHEHDIPPSRPL